MNRDENAAVNIRNEGVRVLRSLPKWAEHVEGETNLAPEFAVVRRPMKRADPGVIAEGGHDDRPQR